MATAGEVIQQIEAEVKAEALNDDERSVVNSLKTLMGTLRGAGPASKPFKDYNEDELSRIAGTLGGFLQNLGDIIARLHKDVAVSEDYIEYRQSAIRQPVLEKLTKEMSKKPTNDDIKAEIKKQIFREKLRMSHMEGHYQEVKHLWWSVRSMLGTIEQRIHVLQGERKATRFDATQAVSN